MTALRYAFVPLLALAAACGGDDAEPEETVYDDETPPEAVEEIPAPMATEFAGELNLAVAERELRSAESAEQLQVQRIIHSSAVESLPIDHNMPSGCSRL